MEILVKTKFHRNAHMVNLLSRYLAQAALPELTRVGAAALEVGSRPLGLGVCFKAVCDGEETNNDGQTHNDAYKKQYVFECHVRRI